LEAAFADLTDSPLAPSEMRPVVEVSDLNGSDEAALPVEDCDEPLGWGDALPEAVCGGAGAG
jgi:hypothetical protein